MTHLARAQPSVDGQVGLPPAARPRARRVVALMVAAVALVGVLAYWDGRREGEASLQQFAQDQSNLALAASAAVAARLHAQGESGGDVLDGPLLALHPGTLLLLFAPGAGRRAQARDGRSFDVPTLADALRDGHDTARLSRAEAASLGLPARTALAGLATVDAGARGRWGVAVVSTAAAERDREIRAGYRLVLAVGLAAGLVFALGSGELRRQRKQMELERELALSQLRLRRDELLVRAGRAATMGTFAMGIAHEISTPLGVIVGRAEQLLGRAPDERTARGLSVISEQAGYIGGVIRGFLDLARGGAPIVATTSPSDVVDGAVRLVEHRFATAEVELSTVLSPELPTIHCDQRLLEHALVNLLLNACDACRPAGHVELSVAVVPDVDDRPRRGARVAFVVVDDGVGISVADAARATEPFFSTKAREGSGLGLAIANEIAATHRGSLTIAPHAPRGTRACLEIPVDGGAADAR